MCVSRSSLSLLLGHAGGPELKISQPPFMSWLDPAPPRGHRPASAERGPRGHSSWTSVLLALRKHQLNLASERDLLGSPGKCNQSKARGPGLSHLFC